ncbi:DUF6232 family protein [Streptomyces sp. NPDC101062]|uniref:DUF6232 family protein n=1 Tax=unclassified Streptomyces TaxID=2593676 RepID=UPI0038119DE3
MESTGPAQPPWNTPPLPQEPPPLRSIPVELRVSKRLLWVGGAYPLQNVARVYTLTIRPRRREAVAAFCKSVLITLAVVFALTILGVASALRDEELAGNVLNVVWIVSVGALIFFFVEMMSVLTAQSPGTGFRPRAPSPSRTRSRTSAPPPTRRRRTGTAP